MFRSVTRQCPAATPAIEMVPYADKHPYEEALDAFCTKNPEFKQTQLYKDLKTLHAQMTNHEVSAIDQCELDFSGWPLLSHACPPLPEGKIEKVKLVACDLFMSPPPVGAQFMPQVPIPDNAPTVDQNKKIINEFLCRSKASSLALEDVELDHELHREPYRHRPMTRIGFFQVNMMALVRDSAVKDIYITPSAVSGKFSDVGTQKLTDECTMHFGHRNKLAAFSPLGRKAFKEKYAGDQAKHQAAHTALRAQLYPERPNCTTQVTHDQAGSQRKTDDAGRNSKDESVDGQHEPDNRTLWAMS